MNDSSSPEGRVRLLLVEDDEDDYLLTRDALHKTDLDVELEWAKTYEDARRTLVSEAARFDVCLVDARLGARSGLDLLRHEHGEETGPPVIVLTGQKDREIDLSAMRKGAFDYLTKDELRPDLLERSIRYAVERAQFARELRGQTAKLTERIKEQLCLSMISSSLHAETGDFKEVLQTIVRMIPPGWQFPEITTARIELEDRVHEVGDHASTRSIQRAGIVVEGETIGSVEVGYVEESRPEADGTPFLEEETNLLEEIARRIADALVRRRAAERLRQSEARFRSLIENASDLVTIVERDGTIRYVSPAIERILGFESEKRVGQSGLDEVHPDDRSRVEAGLGESIAEPDAQHRLQYRVRHADGSWRVLDTVVKNRLQDPAVRGIVVNSRDITVEEEAWRKIQFQSDLLDAVGEAVVAFEPGGSIVYWNAAAEVLFGWSEEEALGADVIDLTVTEQQREEAREILRSLTSGESWSNDTVLQQRDGTGFPALLTVEPLKNEQGETTRLVGIATDISDLKRARSELMKKEEELFHAQRIQALGRVVGGVAHDFNNLLTVIKGYGELLREISVDDQESGCIEEILGAAVRGQELIQQLMAYGRRQVMKREIVEVNRVITGVATMLSPLIGENLRYTTDLSPDTRPVRADPGQLGQVILNLALNARDAMPEGGHLEISTRNVDLAEGDLQGTELVPGPYVMVSVRDTGHGMDKETLEQALEPFFTTKAEGEGTGLGLATVYGIVKQSGGDVRIESQPGEGTVVRVFLPAADLEADLEAELEGDSAAEPATRDKRPARARVLLVEDQPAVRKLLSTTMERANYSVETRANGREAFDLVIERGVTFDLLVTDIRMPVMGGQELFDRLAERGLDLPVLFVSGYDDEIETEADGSRRRLLQKPFTPEELLEAVESLREETSAGKA